MQYCARENSTTTLTTPKYPQLPSSLSLVSLNRWSRQKFTRGRDWFIHFGAAAAFLPGIISSCILRRRLRKKRRVGMRTHSITAGPILIRHCHSNWGHLYEVSPMPCKVNTWHCRHRRSKSSCLVERYGGGWCWFLATSNQASQRLFKVRW